MPTQTARGLRHPGALLLVSCYELGHQPLGVALPAAFLERAGYEPAMLDISVEPLELQRLRGARFAGISVPMHTALRLGVQVARKLRDVNPACHICFFGVYALLNSAFLRREVADSILGGEFEADLVELVEALDRCEPLPDTIHGGARLSPLDHCAPSRSQLPPLVRYAHLVHAGGHHTVGYVEASRGCLHHCKHCPIPAVYAGRLFIVPREVVLQDIRAQVQAGARHITFGDADFLNGPAHSLRVARAMHAEFPDVTFDFTAKVEHILKSRDLMPELHELGALFAVTAVESLSDRVLSCLQKGHTSSDVPEALAILHAAGIAMRPSLLPFTPWSSLDDYIAILDFVEREHIIDHIDPVQYTIRLLVPPGSLLLTSPDMLPHLGQLDEAQLTYTWKHPDPRMDALQQLVSREAQQAAADGEDPRVTFYRIRLMAAQALHGSIPGTPTQSPPSPRRLRPPHLTEPWFC